MKMTEAEKRAKAKYRTKLQVVSLELYPTDADIKEQLAKRTKTGEAKASYIKRLIREDIERNSRRENEKHNT